MDYLTRKNLHNDDERSLNGNLLLLDEITHRKSTFPKNPRTHSLLDERPSEYERLDDLVDFKPQVRAELQKTFLNTQTQSLSRLARTLREGVFDYYMKLFNAKKRQAEGRWRDGFMKFASTDHHLKRGILSDENEYCFESLPGRNPKNWPLGLDEFLDSLCNLPLLALFMEPLKLQAHFKNFLNKKTFAFIKKFKEAKDRANDFENLKKVLTVHLVMAFLKGSFKKLLKVFDVILDLDFSPEEEAAFSQYILDRLAPFVSEVLLEFEPQTIDFYPRFELLEKLFETQKNYNLDLDFESCLSFCTDGNYIYIYLGSPKIRFIKVGTGNGGTVTGKVYLGKHSL